MKGMATQMQEAAVERLVEIGGKSVSRAMRTSKKPYSPKTAQTPKKLTESKGFKEVLEKYGLTEGFITKALVEDIKAKPQERYSELNLGADILGMKKSSEAGGNKVNILVVSEETQRRYEIDGKSEGSSARQA